MTSLQIKRLIDKQAAIYKTATEDHEMEACEILVYDAILDYCTKGEFSIGRCKPQALTGNHNNYTEEKWQIIARLFADFLSEESKLEVDDRVLELLSYYYDRFWRQ